MKKLLPLLALLLALSPSRAATANPVLDASLVVSEALTNDNLDAAKKAATALAETAKTSGQPVIATHAAEIATSTSLDEARVHFKAVSEVTVKLAAGQEGYYVLTCPMANADWVQKTTKVQNPYMGQSMPECGAVKGGKTSMGRPKKGGCCG